MLYTTIKNREQYFKYCNILEKLVCDNKSHKPSQHEIDVLTGLIETWDNAHNTFDLLQPVELLKSLMEDHHIIISDVARLLNVTEQEMSDILQGKERMSEEAALILGRHFKLTPEAFLQPQ